MYQSLALAADIVVVNVLMVLTSLPIVTMGASLRAGNYVIGQLVNDEGSHPARTFFRQFRRHWRTSTIWWLIVLVLGLLGIFEWNILSADLIGEAASFGFRAGLVSGGLILGGISAWLFYNESRQPQKLKAAFLDAALATIRFLPRTLIALGLGVFPFVVLTLAPEQWFAILAFYVVMGWALSVYLFHLVARGAGGPTAITTKE